jgi:hypothetical protein
MADADREQLKSMLQNFIQERPEAAQLDFHQYVSAKMQEVSGLKTAHKEQETETEE